MEILSSPYERQRYCDSQLGQHSGSKYLLSSGLGGIHYSLQDATLFRAEHLHPSDCSWFWKIRDSSINIIGMANLHDFINN